MPTTNSAVVNCCLYEIELNNYCIGNKIYFQQYLLCSTSIEYAILLAKSICNQSSMQSLSSPAVEYHIRLLSGNESVARNITNIYNNVSIHNTLLTSNISEYNNNNDVIIIPMNALFEVVSVLMNDIGVFIVVLQELPSTESAYSFDTMKDMAAYEDQDIYVQEIVPEVRTNETATKTNTEVSSNDVKINADQTGEYADNLNIVAENDAPVVEELLLGTGNQVEVVAEKILMEDPPVLVDPFAALIQDAIDTTNISALLDVISDDSNDHHVKAALTIIYSWIESNEDICDMFMASSKGIKVIEKILSTAATTLITTIATDEDQNNKKEILLNVSKLLWILSREEKHVATSTSTTIISSILELLQNDSLCMETKECLIATIANLTYHKDISRAKVISAGVTPVLLSLIRGIDLSHMTIIEKLVAAIRNISSDNDVKATVVYSGVLPTFVSILRLGSIEAVERTAAIISRISVKDSLVGPIVACGVVAAILEICKKYDRRNRTEERIVFIVEYCVQSLLNLIDNAKVKEMLLNTDNLPTLITIINNYNEPTIRGPLLSIFRILHGTNNEVLIAFGIIPPLVKILQDSNAEEKIQEATIVLLNQILKYENEYVSAPIKGSNLSHHLLKVINRGLNSRTALASALTLLIVLKNEWIDISNNKTLESVIKDDLLVKLKQIVIQGSPTTTRAILSAAWCLLSLMSEYEIYRKAISTAEILSTAITSLFNPGNMKDQNATLDVENINKTTQYIVITIYFLTFDTDTINNISTLGAVLAFCGLLDNHMSDVTIEYTLQILHRLLLVESNKVIFIESEMMPKLIIYFSVGTVSMQRSITGICSSLSSIDAYRLVLGIAGVIPLLLTQLQCNEDEECLQYACKALSNLSQLESNRTYLYSDEAVNALIQIINSNSLQREMIGEICIIISNIIEKNESIRNTISVSNIIPNLINILRVTDKSDLRNVSDPPAENVSKAIWFISRQVESHPSFADVSIISMLMNALQHGSIIVKDNIASVVANISLQNDEYRIMLCNEGVIPLLGKLLRNSSVKTKEKVVAALRNLSKNNDIIKLIIEANLLPILITVLTGSSNTLSERSLNTLLHIAALENYRPLLAHEGLLQKLLYLLQNGTIFCKENSVNILYYYIHDSEISDESIEHIQAALPSLIALYNDDKINDYVKGTIDKFMKVALREEGYRSAVESSRSLELIVNILLSASSVGKEYAASFILHLLNESFSVSKLMEVNVVPALVILLQHGSEKAQVRASLILGMIAMELDDTNDVQNIVPFISSGVVSFLIPLLFNSRHEVRESALGTLRALSNMNSFAETFLSTGTVDTLVSLLKTTTDPECREHIVAIFSNLSNANESILKYISSCQVIPTLITQLNIDKNDSQYEPILLATTSALYNLSNCTNGMAYMSHDSVTKLFITMLENNDITMEIKESCIGILHNLYHYDHLKLIISKSIPIIITILSNNPSSLFQQHAIKLFLKLSYVKDYQTQLSSHSSLSILFDIIKNSNISMESRSNSIHILLRLTDSTKESCRRECMSANILPSVLELLSSGDDNTKEYCSRYLFNMAIDECNRTVLVQKGVVPHLVRLLDMNSPSQCKINAAGAIYHLSTKNNANQLAIASHGAIAALVYLMRNGIQAEKDAAIMALGKLSKQSQNRDEMKRLGVTKSCINYSGMFW